MIAELSPALILILGGFAIPLCAPRYRGGYMIALPVLAFIQLLLLPSGEHGQFQMFGLDLVTLRVDSLSSIFGYVFLIAALLGVVYSLHENDLLQQIAGLVYAGSALGAVLAGDLVTLFLYWEGTAVASVFLIWASRKEAAYNAGMRYLLMQVGSGVLLLAGTLLHYGTTDDLAFDLMSLDGSPASLLIFLAFGIKCAFPLLHNWLQDAYPQATVTGTVILSAFTTKLAVYALARGFAGTEVLVAIGATMTAFPIFYALIENDLRRVLAYSLNSQLGFMVVGIGIGTEMSLNGTAAHAFCHILYKALLFMSMGAVLLRTGTAKGSELGGLFKSMPWTAGFCIVGAASISAFPLFSGFVSKSLIIAAAMEGGYFWTWLVLLFASAGVLPYCGIKIPFFAFFAHDAGIRCAEAPRNMLIAMGIAAALCILIGIFPSALYALLPYEVDFQSYTLSHVVSQLQLLMFSALAFTVLMRMGIYPPELRSINLDSDWLYRKFGAHVLLLARLLAQWAWSGVIQGVQQASVMMHNLAHRHHGPDGALGRTWPTGRMAFWATAMLGGYLIISYWR